MMTPRTELSLALLAAAVGLGYYWKGAKGAAIVGVPTLVVLGTVPVGLNGHPLLQSPQPMVTQ